MVMAYSFIQLSESILYKRVIIILRRIIEESTCAKFAQVDSSDNSSLSKIFFKCFVTTLLSTSKSCARSCQDFSVISFFHNSAQKQTVFITRPPA